MYFKYYKNTIQAWLVPTNYFLVKKRKQFLYN